MLRHPKSVWLVTLNLCTAAAIATATGVSGSQPDDAEVLCASLELIQPSRADKGLRNVRALGSFAYPRARLRAIAVLPPGL
jgi:hypothetical protein